MLGMEKFIFGLVSFESLHSFIPVTAVLCGDENMFGGAAVKIWRITVECATKAPVATNEFLLYFEIFTCWRRLQSVDSISLNLAVDWEVFHQNYTQCSLMC